MAVFEESIRDLLDEATTIAKSLDEYDPHALVPFMDDIGRVADLLSDIHYRIFSYRKQTTGYTF